MYIDNCNDFVQGAPGTDVIIMFLLSNIYSRYEKNLKTYQYGYSIYAPPLFFLINLRGLVTRVQYNAILCYIRAIHC